MKLDLPADCQLPAFVAEEFASSISGEKILKSIGADGNTMIMSKSLGESGWSV